MWFYFRSKSFFLPIKCSFAKFQRKRRMTELQLKFEIRKIFFVKVSFFFAASVFVAFKQSKTTNVLPSFQEAVESWTCGQRVTANVMKSEVSKVVEDLQIYQISLKRDMILPMSFVLISLLRYTFNVFRWRSEVMAWNSRRSSFLNDIETCSNVVHIPSSNGPRISL